MFFVLSSVDIIDQVKQVRFELVYILAIELNSAIAAFE
jgi:hypothetical protein